MLEFRAILVTCVYKFLFVLKAHRHVSESDYSFGAGKCHSKLKKKFTRENRVVQCLCAHHSSEIYQEIIAR